MHQVTLAGHTSPETAYVETHVPSNSQCRVWLQYKPGFGYRRCSQSSDPTQAGLVWKAPRYGTYHDLAVLVQYEDSPYVYIDTLRSHGWHNVTEIDAFAMQHAAALAAPQEQHTLASLRAMAADLEAQESAHQSNQ